MRPIVTDQVAWSFVSVGLSVCHTSEPCKNVYTDRDAVWVDDLGGPKEPCIRWGPDPPWEGAILTGEKGRSIVKYRNTLQPFVRKRLNRSRCRLRCELDGP